MRKVMGWAAWAMPLAGAVAGPVLVGFDVHWAVKVVVGFFIGLSGSFLTWRELTVPPYSTWLGVAFAVAFFLPALLLTIFASDNGLGVLLAIIVGAIFMGWVVTR